MLRLTGKATLGSASPQSLGPPGSCPGCGDLCRPCGRVGLYFGGKRERGWGALSVAATFGVCFVFHGGFVGALLRSFGCRGWLAVGLPLCVPDAVETTADLPLCPFSTSLCSRLSYVSVRRSREQVRTQTRCRCCGAQTKSEGLSVCRGGTCTGEEHQ